MSKLGCSLKEAFGESWSAGPKYFQAKPSAFQTIDPYGPNPRSESFENSTPKEYKDRILKLEEMIQELNKIKSNDFSLTLPQPQKQTREQFKDDNFANIMLNMCSSLTKDRIDCVVKFVLCSLLISNVIELLSMST